MTSTELMNAVEPDTAMDPLLYLLTIDHADLPDPIRLIRNYQSAISRGDLFTAFPFDFAPPGHGEDGGNTARILIDNIDKRIVETIRALATPPTLLVELVLASDPDIVEETWPVFTLTAATGDRMQLQADLVDVDDDNEPVMRWRFTPAMAPALFT